MKSKTNRVILALAIAVIAGIFLFASQRTEVSVMEVKRGNITLAIEETGYVEADDDYEIQAPGTGRITAINVHNGQEVEKGQVLMTLENLELDEKLVLVDGQISNIQTEYAQAQSNLAIAVRDFEELKKQMERETELYRAGAISQANYDTIINKVYKQENLVAAQQAALEGLESHLATLNGQKDIIERKAQQLIITSQVSGKVLEIPVKDGQVVTPGMNLLEVANIGQMTVKTDLLSDDMANITVGQKARITAPVLNGKVINGTVKEISSKAIEKVSALGVLQRRVPVVIALDEEEGNLKPGYEVKVSIETLNKENALVIPWESVRNSSNGNEVMLIDNHKVEFQPIKIGIRNQKEVEVVEGLQAGDNIVRDSILSIDPGTRVKIRE